MTHCTTIALSLLMLGFALGIATWICTETGYAAWQAFRLRRFIKR